MCFLRVSGFLTDSIQQIHSLRARTVISSHWVKAFGSEMSASRRSGGILWTVPEEILVWTMVWSAYMKVILLAKWSAGFRFVVC